MKFFFTNRRRDWTLNSQTKKNLESFRSEIFNANYKIKTTAAINLVLEIYDTTVVDFKIRKYNIIDK